MTRVDLPSLAEQFGKEWHENSRLRYGIYLVACILWIYCILVLRDAAAAARDTWQTAESRNVRARATASSADWLTRAQETAASVGDHELLLWREGSIGLSQAAFQERVNQGVSNAGISVRSVRIAAATDVAVSNELPDIVPLRARVQMEFRPMSFYPWLASIAKTRTENRATIVIDSLTIRAGSFGQPSIADIELVGYLLKAESPANPKRDTGEGSAQPPAPKQGLPK